MLPSTDEPDVHPLQSAPTGGEDSRVEDGTWPPRLDHEFGRSGSPLVHLGRAPVSDQVNSAGGRKRGGMVEGKPASWVNARSTDDGGR